MFGKNQSPEYLTRELAGLLHIFIKMTIEAMRWALECYSLEQVASFKLMQKHGFVSSTCSGSRNIQRL
jgi:hypothetical protein